MEERGEERKTHDTILYRGVLGRRGVGRGSVGGAGYVSRGVKSALNLWEFTGNPVFLYNMYFGTWIEHS